MKLKTMVREDGWININEGVIPKERLARWINESFAKNEDLSSFMRRNKGVLELISGDGQRGYVFVGGLQLDRDYEERMLEIRKLYLNEGKKVPITFINHQKEISGFYWEKPTILN